MIVTMIKNEPTELLWRKSILIIFTSERAQRAERVLSYLFKGKI